MDLGLAGVGSGMSEGRRTTSSLLRYKAQEGLSQGGLALMSLQTQVLAHSLLGRFLCGLCWLSILGLWATRTHGGNMAVPVPGPSLHM